jgi:uncharacterized protein (DUF58 family)
MPKGLRDRIAGRAARWARKRQGLDPLPLVLRARRLYILPTRAGLGFALLLLVMLVAGLNYTNSLALLLTFMFAGFVLVGMHECQRTLQGLELTLANASDCHAGSVGTIELRFANPARTPRRALQIRCAAHPASHFEMAAGAQQIVHVTFEAGRRGRQQLGRLHLSSTAPFGLFRCWTWLHLPIEVIVYPRAAGDLPLPITEAGRRSAQPLSAAPGEDDWASLRAYQTGDSPRSIAWKAWARGAPLMVSQYEGAGGSDRLLSFAGLESLDLEARLSQLCAWVAHCARIDAACGLSLPGVEIAVGRGAEHRVALLRALALYDTDPP